MNLSFLPKVAVKAGRVQCGFVKLDSSGFYSKITGYG